MKKTLFALIGPALLATGGCGSLFGTEALQQASTGFVGCSASEIEISNDEAGFNQRSWDAACGGHLYHCSVVARSSISCTEDRATVAKATTPPSTPMADTTAAAMNRHARDRVGESSWRRVTLKACASTVLLPGTPKMSERTVRGRAGAVVTHIAEVANDDASVAVACATLPGNTFDSAKILDAARDRMLEEIGATLESEEDASLEDYEARDIRFGLGGDHGRVRLLVRDHDLVSMFMAPVNRFTSPEIKAFFGSFEPPPASLSTR